MNVILIFTTTETIEVSLSLFFGSVALNSLVQSPLLLASSLLTLHFACAMTHFERFTQLASLQSKAFSTPCSLNTWLSIHHPVFLHNTFQRYITGNIHRKKLWCVIRHDEQHTSFFSQSPLKQFYDYMTTISRSGFFIA